MTGTGGRVLCAVVIGALLATGCSPNKPATTRGAALDAKSAEGRAAAIIDAVTPSLARVEINLQYDKGDAPTAGGWGVRCPSCGQVHQSGLAEALNEERPAEVGGFVIAPNRVVCPDPVIHPRFVKSIAVRVGQQVLAAKPVAYGINQQALILETTEPIDAAKPLSFDATRKGPYASVTYGRLNGQWTTAVGSVAGGLSQTEDGHKFSAGPSNSLIVDTDGKPVAVCMGERLDPDGSWKGSPLNWRLISADDRGKAMAQIEKRAAASVVRVVLSFRSPRKGKDDFSYRYGNNEESETERNVVGVVSASGQVLILADLKPSVTARLERITVHPAEGTPVQAKFVASLRHYGALVASLPATLRDIAPWRSGSIMGMRDELLLCTSVKLQGENRVSYFDHGRIASFDVGWRGLVFPTISGEGSDTFLFDQNGSLVAIPVALREKVSTDRYYGSNGRAQFAAMDYVKSTLGELAANSDPANVPLGEDEENRLAWLGVELQGLNQQLARANGVSDQTNDGQTGAIVSFVYPNSPAAKAGIVAGDVLLRIHVPDQPQPIQVQIQDLGRFGDNPFPWDELDKLPEQYFDQVPKPWPPVEGTLTRALTDLGFGRPFTVEIFHDGKAVRKPFTVEQSPAHFDMAPKYKDQPLGATVRDMTYEVRRYFQKAEKDPGVIIAKIEMGSSASTAGLKPYEYITHVNDKPVYNVADFQKAVADQKDLKLSVRRMTKGRVVPIKLGGAAATKPATGPTKSESAPATRPTPPRNRPTTRATEPPPSAPPGP